LALDFADATTQIASISTTEMRVEMRVPLKILTTGWAMVITELQAVHRILTWSAQTDVLVEIIRR
jgi:hypothetical protein